MKNDESGEKIGYSRLPLDGMVKVYFPRPRIVIPRSPLTGKPYFSIPSKPMKDGKKGE